MRTWVRDATMLQHTNCGVYVITILIYSSFEVIAIIQRSDEKEIIKWKSPCRILYDWCEREREPAFFRYACVCYARLCSLSEIEFNNDENVLQKGECARNWRESANASANDFTFKSPNKTHASHIDRTGTDRSNEKVVHISCICKHWIVIQANSMAQQQQLS